LWELQGAAFAISNVESFYSCRKRGGARSLQNDDFREKLTVSKVQAIFLDGPAGRIEGILKFRNIPKIWSCLKELDISLKAAWWN